MKKSSLIIFMVIIGVLLTYNYVFAATPNYFTQNELEITDASELNYEGYSIGQTLQDDLKYILVKDNTYSPSYYEVIKGTYTIETCRFIENFQTEQEALEKADTIPQGITTQINVKALNCTTVEQANEVISGMKILVYKGNKKIKTLPLNKLGNYNNEITQNPKSKITVKVVGNVKSEKQIIGKKVKVSWNLKPCSSGTKVFAESITFGNQTVFPKTTEKGSKIIKVSVNGNYECIVTDTMGFEYRAKVKVKGIPFKEGGEPVNKKKPTITLSKLPKKAEPYQPLKITMKSDIPVVFDFNGSTTKLKKKAIFTIYENGEYHYSATTKDGITIENTLKITCYKK